MHPALPLPQYSGQNIAPSARPGHMSFSGYVPLASWGRTWAILAVCPACVDRKGPSWVRPDGRWIFGNPQAAPWAHKEAENRHLAVSPPGDCKWVIASILQKTSGFVGTLAPSCGLWAVCEDGNMQSVCGGNVCSVCLQKDTLLQC